MKQALELDPRNFSILQQISVTYEALRRYKEMAETLDRALAIAPKDIPSRVRRASVDLESSADPKPLHTTIEAILAEDPSAAPVLVDQWLFLALRERDSAAAERAWPPCLTDGCYDENIPFPNGWCRGSCRPVPRRSAGSPQPHLLMRGKNSSKPCATNPIMRRLFVHSVSLMLLWEIRRMPFGKASVQSR